MAAAAASTATIATSCITRTNLVCKAPSTSLVLPATAKVGKVRCSSERKASREERGSDSGMGTALMAAVCAATAITSPPAVALVDERLSTEGTGLPFGLSNNILGWILLGVFALIWSLYIVYTSTLDEDDESGLSL